MTSDPHDSHYLLRQGIAAARSGRRAEARALLTRAMQLDANNTQGWLWLASVIEEPLEQEACLKRVLSLDPDNASARKGLAVVQKHVADGLLDAGIAAARAGEPARACEFLTQVVERDDENLTAWIWLSRVVDSSEDQEICFENILALDSVNIEARQGLEVLHQAREAAAANLWESPVGDDDAPSRPAPTFAAEVLGEDYVERHTTYIPEPEPEPESPAVALWEKYKNELLCPYCASLTQEQDRRCAACGNVLWIKTRRREERSLLLWILIFVQAFNTLMTALLPVAVVFIVGWELGIEDFTRLFPIYFGLPGEVSPQVADAALAMVPRLVFFLSGIPFFVSLALLVALYVRWTPVYYLLLIDAALGLLSSVLGMVFNLSHGMIAIVSGVIGAVVSMVIFGLTIQLEDDFKKDRFRIFLQVDTDITSGIGYLLRGRLYASHNMWALAALHFRRASVLMTYQTDGYIALAIACAHLKEYDLARYALEEAQRINPEDKQIAEVLASLEKKQV